MRRRVRQRLVTFLRGLVVGLALVGYLTAVTGLPLPLPVPAPEALQVDPAVVVRPCGCAVVEDAPCCCCGPDSCCSPKETAPVVEETTVVLLIGEKVRQCHGFDQLWTSGVVALPPTLPVMCSRDTTSI